MKKLELYRNFLKSKRPIDEITLKKIEENLKAKYIYNSNGIEGNTLSLMETNLIIEHGVTIKGKSLKEHLEVKGQEYALNFLTEIMNQKEEISLRTIREFNSLVMINGGGTFKTLPNEIVGANFKTSPPHLVEEHLNKLIENFYNSNEDIIKKVAIFHADFEKIHPFPDGNGRTGRLLMNLELMKEGFPITIIKKEDREDYYNALEKVNLKDFVEEHGGLDYELAIGAANLSGGQRQRLLAAKSILKDSYLYILDEAVSNIDDYSKEIVLNAFDSIKEGKIIIVISHDLETIANSDNIYVLKDKKIIEEGTHAELIEENSLYRKLFTDQQQLKSKFLAKEVE